MRIIPVGFVLNPPWPDEAGCMDALRFGRSQGLSASVHSTIIVMLDWLG
jgi:hypothetical protein